jgi:hypothetical protein
MRCSMPLDLSKSIRECYRFAEECKRLADMAQTESARADYLGMERRWLSLARNYEFAEQGGRKPQSE